MHHPTRRRPWHFNSRQHALLEYATLKQICPEGIYLSLTPGDPSKWSGVLFVRKGPYAPAVLCFIVYLPPRYPDTPPLITFLSDIFHPLVTPLTTYTYTTSSPSSNPVSATDEERLSPGGFALSDAFPHWFTSTGHSAASSVNSSRNSTSTDRDVASENDSQETESRQLSGQRRSGIAIVDALTYMKRAFDDETILDALPLGSAANSGAWKAWRAYRRSTLLFDGDQKASSDQSGLTHTSSSSRTQSTARHPDEWSWDGVWKERVKRGIDASISDQVLFGAGGGDEIIRFNEIQYDQLSMIKEITCHVGEQSGNEQ